MTILVLLTDLFDATGGIQTFNRALVKVMEAECLILHRAEVLRHSMGQAVRERLEHEFSFERFRGERIKPHKM